MLELPGRHRCEHCRQQTPIGLPVYVLSECYTRCATSSECNIIYHLLPATHHLKGAPPSQLRGFLDTCRTVGVDLREHAARGVVSIMVTQIRLLYSYAGLVLHASSAPPAASYSIPAGGHVEILLYIYNAATGFRQLRRFRAASVLYLNA